MRIHSRGFISFILVFASVSLLLGLISFGSADVEVTKAIGVERAYYLQMNAKEAILEAARSGAQEGLRRYLAEIAIRGSKFNIDAAYTNARAEAHKRMVALDGFGVFAPAASSDYDFETILWCGYTDKSELGSLKAKMLSEGKVLLCSGCSRLSDVSCADFVNFIPQTDFLSINSVYLEGRSPIFPLRHGVVGVSVYSAKFNVSGVSVISPSKHVEIRLV